MLTAYFLARAVAVINAYWLALGRGLRHRAAVAWLASQWGCNGRGLPRRRGLGLHGRLARPQPARLCAPGLRSRETLLAIVMKGTFTPLMIPFVALATWTSRHSALQRSASAALNAKIQEIQDSKRFVGGGGSGVPTLCLQSFSLHLRFYRGNCGTGFDRPD